MLCYFAILILSWCMVWVPYLPVAYWMIFAFYVGSSHFIDKWGNREDYWLIWTPEMLFLLALIVLAYSCWRRKIFQPRVVIMFALVCAVSCAAALWSLHDLEQRYSDDGWTDSRFCYTAVVLSLMPLFALLSQGVFLDRIRHGALFRKLPARNT